jgi:hypothetical protein
MNDLIGCRDMFLGRAAIKVAFGEKRTSVDRQDRPVRSRMTHTRNRARVALVGSRLRKLTCRNFQPSSFLISPEPCATEHERDDCVEGDSRHKRMPVNRPPIPTKTAPGSQAFSHDLVAFILITFPSS